MLYVFLCLDLNVYEIRDDVKFVYDLFVLEYILFV